MTLKAFIADIKYRRSLKLVLGDILYMHERKRLEKGLSLLMLIRVYLALRKKKNVVIGIATKGRDVDYNVLCDVDSTLLTVARKRYRFHYNNGIIVEEAPEITKTDYLHFKNVLKEIKADDE